MTVGCCENKPVILNCSNNVTKITKKGILN